MKCHNGCGLIASKKCSRCGIASYCSSSCQKEHWTDHKKTCCTTSNNAPPALPPSSEIIKAKDHIASLSDIPGFSELDAKFSVAAKATQYSKAVKLCRKILLLAKKNGISKRNNYLAVVYANLGSCLGNEGDYEAAEKNFLKAVSIADLENYDVVDGLISLYLNQNRLEDAEPLCIDYLRKSMLKYGKRDQGIIPALRCNAILTKRQQRLDIAIEHLTRIYIILIDVHGQVHSEVQSAAHDLINSLRLMGDLPTALYYAQVNYDSLLDAIPPAAPLAISDGAYTLGTILGYVGTHKKSAEYFAIALEIREKHLGASVLSVADTLEKLAFARIKQSDFSKEVLALLTKSLGIYKVVHGDGHSDCVRLEGLCGKIRSLHVTGTAALTAPAPAPAASN